MDKRDFLTIRRQSYSMIALILFGLLLVSLVHRFFPNVQSAMEADRINSVMAMLGVTLFAIGIPILLRTGYFQKGSREGGLHLSDFLRMKRLVISSVGIGEFFMLFAYYLPIYTYHLYLSVLLGLYGIYSIFPSRATYQKELQSFGVIDEND